MGKIFFYAFMFLSLLITGCVTIGENNMNPLKTCNYVDLSRYTGEWYEIARYQNRFQEGCVGSKAIYTLRDDGKITVVNQCFDKSFSGEIRSVKGKAWVVDKDTNAKLKVSFFWPFAGDYWIIDLGKNYEYAVVGHPTRKYLWILSRTPEMKEEVYQAIMQRLEKQDYNTEKLTRTKQRNQQL